MNHNGLSREAVERLRNELIAAKQGAAERAYGTADVPGFDAYASGESNAFYRAILLLDESLDAELAADAPAPDKEFADRDSDEARHARGLVSTRDTYRRLGWTFDQTNAPIGGEPASPESDGGEPIEAMAERLHLTLDEARALDAKAVK